MTIIELPKYITYAPNRIAGTWRMHVTVGHLRNAIRNNGGAVHAAFRINPDGTWEQFTPAEVFGEDFS